MPKNKTTVGDDQTDINGENVLVVMGRYALFSN